jgi:septal ring factor EnvC (AmiA/AmiB activator)
MAPAFLAVLLAMAAFGAATLPDPAQPGQASPAPLQAPTLSSIVEDLQRINHDLENSEDEFDFIRKRLDKVDELLDQAARNTLIQQQELIQHQQQIAVGLASIEKQLLKIDELSRHGRSEGNPPPSSFPGFPALN